MTIHDTTSSKSSATILVVEDNPRNMKLLTVMLRSMPYVLLHADDGEQALTMLDDYPQVDLLIVDIQLPGMSGIDVMRAVRRHPQHQHVPILALTAAVLPVTREEALQAGCSGFQPKPIDMTAFLSAVSTLLMPSRAA